MKRVGIKDVAEAAGVSIATVSYVINNKPSKVLTAETVDRVNDAIKTLGYVPNLAARALAGNRSRLLGVVIPQTEPGKAFLFSNPFYGELLSSIEYTARINGYHIMVSGAGADQTYLEVAKTRGLDGIIVVGTYPEEHLNEAQAPVVLVDSYWDENIFHTIGIDDERGGYMAARHLLDKGHVRIAHVTGQLKDGGVNQRRYLGYRKALGEAGIAFDPALLYEGTVSFEYGIEAGERIACDAGELGISAAFAAADITAAGLCKGVHAGGLSVPGDISVVGFDDTRLAEICHPPLTTIRQDVTLKGQKAVEALIKPEGGRQTLTLPLSLTERESVIERGKTAGKT
ncbi:LacI family transcriptional regulator [Clostridia bacterium]|nr:LacI family transcriptional regulator [Clostridia bacterium]